MALVAIGILLRRGPSSHMSWRCEMSRQRHSTGARRAGLFLKRIEVIELWCESLTQHLWSNAHASLSMYGRRDKN